MQKTSENYLYSKSNLDLCISFFFCILHVYDLIYFLEFFFYLFYKKINIEKKIICIFVYCTLAVCTAVSWNCWKFYCSRYRQKYWQYKVRLSSALWRSLFNFSRLGIKIQRNLRVMSFTLIFVIGKISANIATYCQNYQHKKRLRDKSVIKFARCSKLS